MMNKFFIHIFFLFFFIDCFSQSYFFIKYKDEIPQYLINSKIADKKVIQTDKLTPSKILEIKSLTTNLVNKDLRLSKIYKIVVQDSYKESFFESVKNDPMIEYIQRPVAYKIDFIPNDSLIEQQWGLFRVNAPQTWDITRGDSNIIIVIIDTGIDYLHPDLKNTIYINYQEDLNNNGILDSYDLNGIDDDGNGFIDDIMGWDFTDRNGFPFDSVSGDYLDWDNDPFDDYGHGTYVAGIIGAEFNNNIGIVGLAPNCKIMNLRAFDPEGSGEEDDVASAILYAIEMGAKVINMSFGDNSFSFVLKDIIEYAHSQGVVLVASAGNSNSDQPHYPSGYNQVISVGASTEYDVKATFSNYGSTLDFLAPGSNITSTEKGNSYTTGQGTSASAPFVSATAGLILSIDSNLTNEEIKQIIKTNSDDVGATGWDEFTGSGILNVYKTITTIVPSIIKFDFPFQDYATNSDSIQIVATCLSGNFQKYELNYGVGLNPQRWYSLIDNGNSQFYNKKIFTLNTSSFSDTSYCLRLVVYFKNGGITEERINFYFDKTPPVGDLINLTNSLYGTRNTILASLYSNEDCVVKMFYRNIGITNFSNISLDGFSTNNYFVKKLHYGFIPKELVEQNNEYEIYFELINLAGLKSTLKNGNEYFKVKVKDYIKLVSTYKKNYELPSGLIYGEQININANPNAEIFISEYGKTDSTLIYELTGNKFKKISTLNHLLPKSIGYFNANNKYDMLILKWPEVKIIEQQQQHSLKFITKYFNNSGSIRPILVDDIDDDNFYEVISIREESDTIDIWQISNDLSLSKEKSLINFSSKNYIVENPNEFLSLDATVADINSDGKKEIWICDNDGDLISYNINSSNTYSDYKYFSTLFSGNSAKLSTGDFDGDGVQEIATLLSSISDIDIAPFNLLLVFNIINDTLNILYDNAIIDPSSEFTSIIQSAGKDIKFVNLNNDIKEELIVFNFPYSYIFSDNDIIHYKENVNSNIIFSGDVDNNGLIDIAFPTSSGIEFIEFNPTDQAILPYDVEGYSIDENKIKLNWKTEGDKTYIYKGLSESTIILFDSTAKNYYLDSNVIINTNYYYKFQSFDDFKNINKSQLTDFIVVHSHIPGKLNNVNAVGKKNIILNFSEKIKNKIENLECFNIIGFGTPSTASTSSEYSYLLTFSRDLPLGENRLTINDLKDYYNSPINSDTLTFIVQADSTIKELFITSFEIIDRFNLRIDFNYDINQTTASILSNYSFEPFNEVRSVKFENTNLNSVYLKTLNAIGSVGREYKLTIRNIAAADTSEDIFIREGAGSVITISTNADNLSDIYVYPNPVKFLSENPTVTFANLTKNAEINIFDLNGMRMKTLIEADGDGGLTWNLQDENGNEIGSGIYIYHVTAKDENDNKFDERIGKFVVIK
ncbi:MAG: S8 family serine peptidase [Ignavibacteriales bacterium]|nr:S8 family serine peptidase [Ignavibacteriales bacterium]